LIRPQSSARRPAGVVGKKSEKMAELLDKLGKPDILSNCSRIAERFRGTQIFGTQKKHSVLLTDDAQERGNTSEQKNCSFSLRMLSLSRGGKKARVVCEGDRRWNSQMNG
jgi:hypothetical protein